MENLWLKIKNKNNKNEKTFLCTPPPSPFLLGGGEVEPPTKFSKRGGLTVSQFWEGGCGERGGDFLGGMVGGGGVAVLLWKKSEIFNDKKLYETKMFFSVITKNLNWQILTKNSVTSKRWDAVKDNYGGFPKNQYIGGNFDEGARLIP